MVGMADAAASLRVAVVGAGPAGLRATEILARHGVRPILIDEAAKPGGQIYRQPPAGAERAGTEIYGFEATKAARLHALLPALASQVDYRPNTLVWNITRDGDGFRLDLLVGEGVATVAVDRIVLATGAVDRALPFQGWLTPGVFTLGAAQIALKSQGVAIGRRVALVGAGPLLPLLTTQYLAARLKPVAVLDVTPFATKLRALPGLLNQPATLLKGAYYVARAMAGGVLIQSGIRALCALGTDRITGLKFTTRGGKDHVIACDAIAASFGLRSETQLADLAGCRFQFNANGRQWEPVRDSAGHASVAGVYLAGDGASIGGADVAELQGERTALTLLADAGHRTDVERVQLLDRALSRQARFRAALDASYPFPAHLLPTIPDDTVVCRCEGVTAGTLRTTIALRDPADVNRLKAFTRLGMGRCQGRMCGHVGAELLADARNGDTIGAGRLRAQPPVKPLPLSAVLSAETMS